MAVSTMLTFKEDVVAKKWMMKPFVKLYLKKQQSLYVRDWLQELGLQS